jgi:hypothetical protein
MHSLYITSTALIKQSYKPHRTEHIKHRVYVVHPSVGLRPPTSSSSLLVYDLLTFIYFCAQSHRSQLHTGQVICAQCTRSTFLEIGLRHRANSSIAQILTCDVCAPSNLHSLALSQTYYAHSQPLLLLHHLASYLYNYNKA